MINLLGSVKQLFPNLLGLREVPLIDKDGLTVGYSSTFYDLNNKALGGGTSVAPEVARRIAVAETLERGLYRKLSDDPILREKFWLDKIDSTLGFACGFEQDKTAYRSFCEALEKWCLSQIIDYHYKVEPAQLPPLSKLAKFMVSHFESYRFFQKQFFLIFPYDNSGIKLTFTLFVGLSEIGIFPGSHVCSQQDDSFTHPVVEGWRNFRNYKILDKSEAKIENLIEKRILHFGKNKNLGLQQIIQATNSNWKKPVIVLFNEYDTKIENVFLYRTLMADFVPISHGDSSRFVI